jgi:HSP20 family protein
MAKKRKSPGEGRALEPIEDLFIGLSRDFLKGARGLGRTFLNEMPVDLAEREKDIVVRADLPGFDKKDISVEATEDTLTISASRKEERSVAKENYYLRERSSNRIQRTIPLPERVDIRKAKTTFSEGLLEVELPKKDIAKKKKVNLM